ncbi:MAG: CRISPR-associated ring nuclease Csm6 [Candidatus Rokuibacteriota bacterium]
MVSVAGLTPQVVTETLYWLTQVRKPPAVVSEIWLITTAVGKRIAERMLLDSPDGSFLRFCRDYGLDAQRIRFGEQQIVIIPGGHGRPLEDIRTPEDSSAAADFILDFIRQQTSDPSRVLHCSIAGGRKTMGLYLGLALQLYGLPTDTLSHVLVSPPELESASDFHYPPSGTGWVKVRGKRIHARNIRVELAVMPLLMLRGKLRASEDPDRSYTSLVRRAQEDYALLGAPPRAVVERGKLALAVDGRLVRLSPLETAMYLVFVTARREVCGLTGCPGCHRCTLAASDFLGDEGVARIRATLRDLKTKGARLEELRGWGVSDPTDAEKRFREVRSRINRKIQRGLSGDAWPALYTISALRLPGEDRVRYGIRLDARLLTIA